MIPDHDCVPGLERPVTVSEYAKLEGLTETQVLSLIRDLKIRNAAYFRGQWLIEAPRNCEARLAQLRGEQPTPRDDKVNVARNDKGNIPALEDKEFWGPIEREAASYDTPTDAEQNVTPAATIVTKSVTLPSQTNAKTEEIERDAEAERLRVNLVKSHWRYDKCTPAQQQALLGTKQYAERPQPADFGLNQGDVRIHGGHYAAHEGLTYAKDQWRPGLLIMWLITYVCVCGGFLWAWVSGQLKGSPGEMLGLVAVIAPVTLWLVAAFVCPLLETCLDASQRKRSRSNYLRYQEALELHQLYQSTAQAAVHEAEQAALRKKRSYWLVLDGYSFEHATAEVLRKHRFTALVTRGSGDGGVDIEVTRNGLRGVVQCKAHINCVGPSVVRDLYGVIHHSGASFGIIVSRNGFTQGAVDFARDKPIYFLDVSHLIAMQEGRDVLAKAFDDQQ